MGKPIIWLKNWLLYRKYEKEPLQRRTRRITVSISSVLYSLKSQFTFFYITRCMHRDGIKTGQNCVCDIKYFDSPTI